MDFWKQAKFLNVRTLYKRKFNIMFMGTSYFGNTIFYSRVNIEN
jgi:hypothetical protein